MIRRYFIVLGTTFSGSGFVSELIASAPNISCPLKDREYLLPHSPGGIQELLAASGVAFSNPISNFAYHRFLETSSRLGRKSNFFSSGGEYGALLPNYWEALENLCSAIVETDYEYGLYWDWFTSNLIQKQSKYSRLFASKALPVILLKEPSYILESVRTFHDSIFAGGPNILLNQAGSAWNPNATKNLFSNCHVIVVIRDPRDQFFEMKKFKKATNAEKFCTWYRAMRKKIEGAASEGVFLLVQFENAVTKFENLKSELATLAQLDKNTFDFDHEPSKNNIGQGARFLDSGELHIIQKELSMFFWEEELC